MRQVLHRFSDWIVPPLPTSDAATTALVERAILQRALRMGVLMIVLTPPTVLLWVVLLWNRAAPRGLFYWVVAVLVTAGVQGLVNLNFDRDNGDVDRQITKQSMVLVASGTAWGLLPVLALPNDPTWYGMMGMLVIAPMAVNTIMNSSVIRLFLSFQVSLTAAAAAGFYLADDPVAQSALVVLLYALPFSVAIARITRWAEYRAAQLGSVNAQIAEQLIEANRHLGYEASHDSLTGLTNRHEFIRVLEERVDEATSYDFGVLFIDLDRFKVVNDSLGHAAGDELLCEASNRIRKRLRPDDLLARLGGDEFTVLVEGADALHAVATRILGAFDAPFEIRGRDYDVKASVGVARAEPNLSATDMLRAADAALYVAKDEGRGQIRMFDDQLRTRIDRRLDDEAELRDALDGASIEGWFQPIVDLETGAVAAAECLARWIDGDIVRSAGDFMSLVVESGLEADLSRAVGRDLGRVLDNPIVKERRIRLGLNVPPRQIQEILDDLELEDDLSGVTLEITETGVIADLELARARLEEARSRGASVWLDDFGQGDSSLSLLTKLPLDGVKIDKSFVASMFTSRAARIVVVAITEIGRSLGLEVIAEGVETLEQATVLRQLGVTHAQGFLLAPAFAPDHFLAELEQGRDWSGLLQCEASTT